MKGKLVIFSAPSGSGKTTIVKHLLQTNLPLEFSVSACNRERRKGEKEGRDYYFLSDEEFRNHIQRGDFVEWEEVYPGRYYGTLYSEVERIWNKNNIVLFDVDVIGGMNLKKKFGKNALSVFVKVPSVKEIENRLRKRSSDSEDSIHERIRKIQEEMKFESAFDKVLMNDNLNDAFQEAEKIVKDFLNEQI